MVTTDIQGLAAFPPSNILQKIDHCISALVTYPRAFEFLKEVLGKKEVISHHRLGLCYLKVIRKASSWHITSMVTSWYMSWWYVVKGIVWQMEIRMFVVRYFLLPVQIEKIWFVVLIPLSPSIHEHFYSSSIFIEVSPVQI